MKIAFDKIKTNHVNSSLKCVKPSITNKNRIEIKKGSLASLSNVHFIFPKTWNERDRIQNLINANTILRL